MGAVSPPAGVRLASPTLAAPTCTAPYGTAAVTMNVRQIWTIRLGTPARWTSGPSKPPVAEPDDSSRGMREGGKAGAALLPRTPSEVEVGVTAVGTETARVARVLAAAGVG
jgi:hypothetical protein